MKNTTYSLFKFIKRHYIWSALILLVVILAATKVFGGSGHGNVETIVVKPQEFLRTVAVSGKVTPADDVELGFEKTGRIAAVYKKEGDRTRAGETLVVLSSGNASADIQKAKADLAAELARLNELKRSNDSDSAVSAREQELFLALTDAFTLSDEVIRNTIGQFYNQGTIAIDFGDHEDRNDFNNKRRELLIMLKKWKERMDSISAETFTSDDINAAHANLKSTKDLLDRLSVFVSTFRAERGSYTQVQIDKFKADLSAAKSEIATVIARLVSTKESVRDIQSDLPYQEARVQAAQATVKMFESEYGKHYITSPFNGIVTQQDARVGEIVSAQTVVMRLISDAAFTIETYVPEINIKEVAVGNIAKVTLDAYGDDEVFEARVILIDPGETIKDGVSTYKVLFEFLREDERLKSGMTANVVITTQEKQNALLIPQEALVRRNGFTYLYVLIGKEKVEKQITTGAVASNGYIEVISGLSEGEVVVKNAQ